MIQEAAYRPRPLGKGFALDLIANKRVSRRRIFPFRFRGSCRLEPCLDGEVAPELVQSAGGFDEGVLKARLEVAINVTDATDDLDSGATVLDAHPYLRATPIGLLLFGAGFAPLGFLLCLQGRDPCGFSDCGQVQEVFFSHAVIVLREIPKVRLSPRSEEERS